jgi:hypothetical protein
MSNFSQFTIKTPINNINDIGKLENLISNMYNVTDTSYITTYLNFFNAIYLRLNFSKYWQVKNLNEDIYFLNSVYKTCDEILKTNYTIFDNTVQRYEYRYVGMTDKKLEKFIKIKNNIRDIGNTEITNTDLDYLYELFKLKVKHNNHYMWFSKNLIHFTISPKQVDRFGHRQLLVVDSRSIDEIVNNIEIKMYTPFGDYISNSSNDNFEVFRYMKIKSPNFFKQLYDKEIKSIMNKL